MACSNGVKAEPSDWGYDFVRSFLESFCSIRTLVEGINRSINFVLSEEELGSTPPQCA